MKINLSKYLFFVGIILFFIGLFFSRAILSISPAVLIIAAFTKDTFKTDFRNLLKNKQVYFPFILYLIGFLCFPLAENKDKWAELLFKNLPYLVFPFSLVILKDHIIQHYKFILYLCIALVTFIVSSTLIRLYNNYELYTWMIRNSKNIEATGGMFHIHFGLMASLCIMFCYTLIRYSDSSKIEKLVLSVIALFLFVGIHLLAYRTGIVTIYVAIIAEILLNIFRNKKYLFGGLLIALVVVLPFVAYYTIKPVQDRINNTTTDIYRYKSGKDINYYSLSQRFAAWENALVIYKRNVIFGTSAADLEDEMVNQYKVRDFGLKKENQVLIHNQYIFYAVCYGTIGIIIFLYFLLNSIAIAWRTKNPMYIQFLIMFSAVFVIDTILEMQTGQNMFVFFYITLAFIPLSFSKKSV